MVRRLSLVVVSAAITVSMYGEGIRDLYRLDRLARYRSSVSVGSVSSYDRTGGNDDGFSGEHSFIREEDDGLVIAELEGPGVIYRIWTPTPTYDLTEFYFDGEEEPRISIPFRDLFTGDHAPFLPPLAGYGGGGFYSYVPLGYRKSCKIVVRAEQFQFYQINYGTYPEEAGIETYPGAESKALRNSVDQARELLSRAGTDISDAVVPQRIPLTLIETRVQLEPGRPATIFETGTPGRIVGVRMSPASAFTGKNRDVVLRAWWDGEEQPSIEVPAGDFFGYGWGQPATKSLLVGTSGEVNYAYFPMPFDAGAHLELVAEGEVAPPESILVEIIHADMPKMADEGRFHAVWRRENPTTPGKPFTFLEALGRGHLVGVVLQAQGPESGFTEFFEGDDQTTIDGKLVIHGTGSEDFFNGGWYDVPGRWSGPISLPLSGALDYNKPLSRTGGYRLFITDAYPFNESILQTIEHSPEENKGITDYAAVTYFYADAGLVVDSALPPPEERRIRDLERIVFTPGWNLPIQSFSLRNATISKKVDELRSGDVRYLSMETEGEGAFGRHHISFLCNLPAAGRYAVSIETLNGYSGAVVQLFRDEKAVGEFVDLYSAQRELSELTRLGEFEFDQGPNELFFKLIDKNDLSTGANFDIVRIVFDRLP